jgi:hypothetical protein
MAASRAVAMRGGLCVLELPTLRSTSLGNRETHWPDEGEESVLRPALRIARHPGNTLLGVW